MPNTIRHPGEVAAVPTAAAVRPAVTRLSRSRLVAATATIASLAALATAAAPASATPRLSYVVVLAPVADCAATRTAVAATYDVRVATTYDSIFCGFAARLSTEQVARLTSDPAVQYVTPDTPASAG